MNVEQLVNVAMGEFQWLSMLLIIVILITTIGIAYLVSMIKHMQSQIDHQRELIVNLMRKVS